MPTATLRFDLADPDDEREHRYALAGKDALLALHEVAEEIRSRLKHGDISDDTRAILEDVRRSIPDELVDLLR